MAPMDPKDFGTLGRGRGSFSGKAELGTQVRGYTQLNDITKKMEIATKAAAKAFAKDLVGSVKSGSKSIKEARAEVVKFEEEFKTAGEIAIKALAGTIKDTDKLGAAITRDTEFIIKFARQHGLSLEQAGNAYEAAKAKQKAWLDTGKSKIKEYLVAAGGLAALTSAYSKRIHEVYTGQSLMVTSMRLTGAEGKKAWASLPTYIDEYRDASRNAAVMANKWGLSVEDARAQIDKLAPSVAIGTVNAKDLGWNIKKTGDELNKFAMVSGQSFEESLETMNDLMYTQGKRFDEALVDMKKAAGAYEALGKTVKGASAPTRTQFFAALKDVRGEMGSAHVNTVAMTAAMSKFAEAAVRAGASGKTVGEAMRAIPQLAKGLPEFFKYQLGGEMRRGVERGAKEFQNLPPEVKKQMDMVKKQLGDFSPQADMAAYDVLMGTPEGIKRMLQSWKKLPKAMQFDRLTKSLGMDTQKALAVMEGINSNNEKTLDNAAADIKASGADLDKQDLPANLRRNVKAVDDAAMKAKFLADKITELKDKNVELFAAGSALVLGIMKLKDVMVAIQATSILRGGAGAAGAVGGAGGGLANATGAATAGLSKFAKAAVWGGGALAALSAGYAIGTMLDEWLGLSDKVSSALFSWNKNLLILEERERRAKGHAGTAAGFEDGGAMGAVMADAKKMMDMATKGVTPEKRGGGRVEITKELIRSRAEASMKADLASGQMKRDDYDKIMGSVDTLLKDFKTVAPSSRVTAPGPAATGSVPAAATGQKTPGLPAEANAASQKPAKTSYDPSTKQLTIINLNDFSIQQAMAEMFKTQQAAQPKRG